MSICKNIVRVLQALLIATLSQDAFCVTPTPNILFVIMDDVGVDQFSLFGYGGNGVGALGAPKTPTLNALAAGGVKFRNAWSTPECSPSRVSIFTGRYPMRHGVMAALLPSDLAISQQSPYEVTTPTILRKKGYKSALIGKAHFTNSPTNPQTPSTNPYGNDSVTQLGWDYFKGWFDGGPNAIDTTAGGVVPVNPTTGFGPYRCGFVPNKATDNTNGADTGACYSSAGTCSLLTVGPSTPVPGFSCLQSGGIFVPNTSCGSKAITPNFTTQNGYYVGELVEMNAGAQTVTAPANSPLSRGYRTIIEADQAIKWINSQASGNPWMTTLAFSSAHTPFQPAPDNLIYTPSTTVAQDCTDNSTDSRRLMTQMIESMDHELGRVLIETGLATQATDGSIVYDPARSNTLIVVVGDNGSYAADVRLPFDVNHSKGTVYQTGVWVPLIVSGPMVSSPGRDVESMVNIVDLFKLFGDVAGVDVRASVPSTHALDAQAMTPYLLNPNQDANPVRTSNFTQYGENARPLGYLNGGCVIQSANTCTILFPAKSVCEVDYGGIWYGKGTTQPIPNSYPEGLSNCCQVNQFRYSQDPSSVVSVLPDNSFAVRNQSYKLVQQTVTNYDPANPSLGSSCITQTTNEFYAVNQNAPNPQLDLPNKYLGQPANNLLAAGMPPLNSLQQANYNALYADLSTTVASAQPCMGDANLDGVINASDIRNQLTWINATNSTSTWWDLNQDGYTNRTDIGLLLQKQNTVCALPR
jgi:arylsulfatase A-like enzyme